MRFDWDELYRIKSEGFLAIVPHPDPAAGLFLLNYTARAQYQVAWDQYPALLDCRGTIVDGAGEVIARPFRKFFNAGERPETSLERLAALGAPEVTHKLDGCLRIDTTLNCWGGGMVTIGDVVNHGLSPTLIGLDEQGKLVPCTVMERFHNSRKDNWLAMTVSHCGVPRRDLGHPTVLRVTENHHIALNGSFRAAGEARPGDTIMSYVLAPSRSVLHLIESALLGDGSLPHMQGSYHYQEPHRIAHDEYVEAIRGWLGPCALAPRETRSGYGSTVRWAQSKVYPILAELRAKWYPDGKKRVPDDLSWLDDFSVAKWYMDDGSLAHHDGQQDRALFATNGFTQGEVERLAARLAEMYGVSCTLYHSKGRCLRVNAGRHGEIDAFWRAISPWVVNCMRYKLPGRYRDEACQRYPTGAENYLPQEGMVLKVERLAIARRNFPWGRVGYDIRTTTGNYFAKGMLVHNSMAVLYPYGGGYRFATRGSFVSEQARRATALWELHYADTLNARLDPAMTYVCELVGLANRIVVRYDEEALILLGLVVTATGREMPHSILRAEAQRLGLPFVQEEPSPGGDWLAWQTLLTTERANFEGFVLAWPGHGVRVKVKLAEYVRLHRLVSGLSEHLVWEYLRDGTDLEALRIALPEESLPWLDATTAALRRDHAALEAEVARIVALVRAAGLDPASRVDRKAVAELVLREADAVRPAAFRALDGKGYADLLWRMVEPRGVEPVRPLEDG